MRDAANILRAAADKFESGEYKWAQGSRGGPVPQGCQCAFTAIMHSSSPMGTGRNGAIAALTVTVGENGPSAFSDIVLWNDAPERTVGEIIAAMRATADRVAA